jgi:acyl phosphate:glycerol-3-phosphate acyltransferase
MSYLIGSIPFSVMVAKLHGKNLFEIGSKNAGATNVYRALGIRWAILVFVLDMLKAVSALLLANFLNIEANYLVLVGLCAVVGHTFTPFLKFKGGKGVATGLGLVLYFSPVVFLICLLLGLSIIKVTGYVSLASIVGASVMALMVWLPILNLPLSLKVMLGLMCAYIIIKHKSNIQRLLAGTENKITNK